MANSQTLFAANIPNLQEVRDRLIVSQQLSPTRKRDLISALERIGEALNLPLAQIVADPAWLQSRVGKVVPAQLDITTKTWSNIITNALAALACTGVVKRPFQPVQLNKEWQVLWDRIEDSSMRTSLGRFIRFCSNNHIKPAELTDDTVGQFKAALISASLRKRPDLAVYQATRCWNLVSSRVKGWPQQQLIVPNRSIRIMPVGGYIAPSFERDLEKYLDSLRCADPLDATSPSRPRATSTVNHRREQINRFFAYLVASGMAPETIPDLRTLLQPDVVRRGLRQMMQRKDGAPTSTMAILAGVLTTIARNYVGLPQSDLAILQDINRRLAPKHRGMTPKNRTRLRQFDDPIAVQRILQLPQRLLKESSRAGLSHKRAALLVEVALAIELFLMCVPRIKNVASIHLDHNLHRYRAIRAGGCHLVFESSEVKNGEHLEFDLNPETVALLDRFIERHRPHLVPAECRWLFAKRDGSAHVGEGALALRVCGTILKRTGLVMNPHLFRSLGAKLYLDANPGGYEVVRRMLGHTSLSTVLRAYTGMESVSTARHFDQTVRNLRDAVPAPRRRSPRRPR